LLGASLRLTLRASALRACLRQSKIAPGDFVSSASRDPDTGVVAAQPRKPPACATTWQAGPPAGGNDWQGIVALAWGRHGRGGTIRESPIDNKPTRL
jgi:hypothetical protein